MQGGLRLLAAGSDRAFRVFSTIQDQQSRELSQKHVGRKAKKLKVRETGWPPYLGLSKAES
eukprot:1160824-Pelagomonas_calceolata.AAC.13